MSRHPNARPAARAAGPELVVLARWEEFLAWLFPQTARWPRSLRYPLAQRVQERALDIAEQLVEARYVPSRRATLLRTANLDLERMRLLLRLARSAGIMPRRGHETAARALDETGRMLHGCRATLASRGGGNPGP